MMSSSAEARQAAICPSISSCDMLERENIYYDCTGFFGAYLDMHALSE